MAILVTGIAKNKLNVCSSFFDQANASFWPKIPKMWIIWVI